MDPANPLMSGVVQNQDSYMKGKIAQRWYYDRIEPALEDAFDEFYRKTGRQLRLPRAVSLRGCRVHPRRHGLLHGNGQGDRRLPARRKGIAAGCLTVFVFRPFPARQIVEALQGLQGVHGLRADGRSAVDHRQPPDARDQGGLLRCDDRPERAGPDRAHAAGFTAARPAWAAATCGPATSSPRSTT